MIWILIIVKNQESGDDFYLDADTSNTSRSETNVNDGPKSPKQTVSTIISSNINNKDQIHSTRKRHLNCEKWEKM